MDISFFESEDVPQPRDQIRIERLTAVPYPDGWRVRLGIDVTPFQERPSLEITVQAADGRPIAQLSVIETMHRAMEFTIHVRGVNNPAGHYLARAELYYDSLEAPQARLETPFTIPDANER